MIRLSFIQALIYPDFVSSDLKDLAYKMNNKNLKEIALATGSLPYFIEGVSGIFGEQEGVYRDGGLMNYQLNEDYRPGEGLTLFFHYQERIVPGWFDKKLTWKKPASKSLDRVLQIFPSATFIKMLPDGRIPDRTDFVTYVNDPKERIQRWDQVSETSQLLAEDFMESVEIRGKFVIE